MKITLLWHNQANQEHRNLRSADWRDLVVLSFKSDYGWCSFSTTVLQLWNSFPPEVKAVQESADSFKKNLKTHLFQQ